MDGKVNMKSRKINSIKGMAQCKGCDLDRYRYYTEDIYYRSNNTFHLFPLSSNGESVFKKSYCGKMVYNNIYHRINLYVHYWGHSPFCIKLRKFTLKNYAEFQKDDE